MLGSDCPATVANACRANQSSDGDEHAGHADADAKCLQRGLA
jgi:hypothetical protein